MIFAIAKSDDMSAPDSIILQAVNLRVSAIITVIVSQALITELQASPSPTHKHTVAIKKRAILADGSFVFTY